MHLSREFDLPREQARDLIGWLQDHRFDRASALENVLPCETAFVDAYLDCVYTRDGRGNGWLALRHEEPETFSERLVCIGNLWSPVFASRRTIRATLNSYYEGFIAAATTSYQKGRERMDVAGRTLAEVPPTHWILGEMHFGVLTTITSLFKAEGHEAGAIATLALGLYRQDRGHYPEALANLVPDYLPVVPSEPFSEGPLLYRLDERVGYVLYSVYENAIDDGGVLHDETGNVHHNPFGSDWIFSLPRREPDQEFVFVPAPATTGSGAK
jgi:hypothetical protein